MAEGELIPTDQLDRTTINVAVADRLRSEVQSGYLVPGTRLRQADVAKRFGVSTTPVREAFQFLQAEGLLQIDPHRGAIVFQPTIDDMREAFEIRLVLERLAIAKAVPKMAEGAFTNLGALIQTMQETNDPAQWRQLNTRFHMEGYEFSQLPRLVALIANLTHATSGYSQMATLRSPRSRWADAQHKQLLEAFRRGDVDGAQLIIKEHLNLTVSFMVDFLEGHETKGVSPLEDSSEPTAHFGD